VDAKLVLTLHIHRQKKDCANNSKQSTTTQFSSMVHTTPEALITDSNGTAKPQKQLTKGHKLVQSFFCKVGPCSHAPQGTQQPTNTAPINEKTNGKS
jgi:hypothetical protein